VQKSSSQNRFIDQPGLWRFIIGGIIIALAILSLILSASRTNAQYFLTIQELLEQKERWLEQTVRISGAVIGESIDVDVEKQKIQFRMANIPGDPKVIEDQGGLASALHQAVLAGSGPTLEVVYVGMKPDLLTNEAQAIVTGVLGEDGLFYADELLLKCPVRYEEALPEQSQFSEGADHQ
jgi:cytochrome c-type biogenesis protein CcmE